MRDQPAPLKGLESSTPPAPPAPPQPRIVREDGSLTLLGQIALVAGTAGLLIWAAPDLAAWLRGAPPVTVQTSAPANCPPTK